MSSFERNILPVEENHLLTNKGGLEGRHPTCRPSYFQPVGMRKKCHLLSRHFSFFFTTQIYVCECCLAFTKRQIHLMSDGGGITANTAMKDVVNVDDIKVPQTVTKT